MDEEKTFTVSPSDLKPGEEITLPEELQIEMLQFFFKTSIPRKKRREQLKAEQERLAGENAD